MRHIDPGKWNGLDACEHSIWESQLAAIHGISDRGDLRSVPFLGLQSQPQHGFLQFEAAQTASISHHLRLRSPLICAKTEAQNEGKRYKSCDLHCISDRGDHLISQLNSKNLAAISTLGFRDKLIFPPR